MNDKEKKVPAFTDSTGHEWHVEITLADVKRVSKTLGINLATDALEGNESGESPFLMTLATDIIALVDMLYVLIKPQCDELGLDDEQFAQRLTPESLPDLYGAFFNSLQIFFAGLKKEAVVAAIQKTIDTVREGDKQIAKHVLRVDPKKLISGALSTSGQALRELSRGRSAGTS